MPSATSFFKGNFYTSELILSKYLLQYFTFLKHCFNVIDFHYKKFYIGKSSEGR